MYHNKNRNKGVKIKLGIVLAFFAVLLSCIAILLCNPFGVQKNAELSETENSSKVEHISAPKLDIATTATTVNSGTTVSAMATAWQNAVSQSSSSNQVTFVLQANWTASSNSSYGTAFGTNTTAFSNGRLFVPNGKNIVIDLNGKTINRNLTREYSSGSVIYNAGTLVIEDSAGGGVITGGFAENKGGGILNNGTLTINGGAIINNTAAAGGGVYSNGYLTLNNGSISKNNAGYTEYDNDDCYGSGGGVYVGDFTDFHMYGGAISYNKSWDNGGGGIYCYNSYFHMYGGSVSNNGDIGMGDGGGIYLGGNEESFANLYGGSISNNRTDGDGGGIFVYGQSCMEMFDGAEITDNYAYVAGGGICWRYNAEDSTIRISGGKIANNQSSGGSGIYVAGNNKYLEINGGEISKNTVNDSGDAVDGIGVYLGSGVTCYISGGKITGNTKAECGGGVYAYSATIEMSGGEISNNTATDSSEQGGGVYLAGSSTFEMLNGQIIDNLSNNQGGGVYIDTNSRFELLGGVIRNNKTSLNNGAGGIYCSGTFVLNGAPIVKDNFTANGTRSNVYLASGKVITVTGSLVGANIGITMVSGTGTFTTGYNTYNAYDPSIFFFSDSYSYSVISSSNQAALSAGSSTKTYIYWRVVGNPGDGTRYITGSDATVTYTGEAFTVTALTSPSGNSITIAARSYKNSYGTSISTTSEIKNAGTYSFVVNNASYSNATFTLKIEQADMDDCAISFAPQTYTGNRLMPTPTVIYNGTVLTTGFSTTSWLNNRDVGTASVTIKGMGNFTGTVTKNFTINPKDISTVTTTLGTTSYTYNGTARQPSVTVKNGSTTVSDSYYTVTYSNNTNAGTAYVVIMGQGNYTGSVTKTFTINPQALTSSNSTITLGTTSYTYDGSAKTPTVSSAKFGSTTIPTNSYSIAYSNNVNASTTATVSVTFSGNYSGTVNKTFTINPASLSSANITFGLSSYPYSGVAIVPVPTVKLSNKTLAQNVDFTVAYANNINAGQGDVTVTGTGNYTGTATGNFTIDKRQVFISGISVANKHYDGTATANIDTSKLSLSGLVDADKNNKDKLWVTFATGTSFDSSAVGLRSVTISNLTLTGTSAGNYEFEFDEIMCYAQIYPATIKVSGVAVKDGGKKYDGTVGGVVYDLSGLTVTAIDGAIVEAEKESLISNIVINGAYKNKNVGTDGVVIYGYILGGQYAGNYVVDTDASEESVTAEITKAEVRVTLGKTEYVSTYGNALKITYSQDCDVKSESINLALEFYDEAGNVKLTGVPADAGKYLVKVVVDPDDENAGNYTVITSGEGIISQAKVTINKASLTVTAEDKEISYNDAKPANGDYVLIYNGWLNGDKAEFESGNISFVTAITITTDYEKGSDAGEYDITLSDGELKNYTLTFVDGVLTVKAKKVVVTIADKTSVYGAEEAELTSDGTDDMQITLEREEGKDAGRYAITGTWDNANYEITFVDGVYEITKAKLTVTANAQTITYGDKATANGVVYSGFANDEDETVLGGELAYRFTYTQYGDIYELADDKLTAIKYYVIPYGLTADNYEIEFVNGLLTVERKSATVNVSNASNDITNVPGDREEASDKVKYQVTGTVNGDDLIVKINISENGTRQEGNASYGVTWCAVGAYDITATFDNPNYVVTFVYENGANKGTYTISQGTLTITANTVIISYGEEVKFSSDIDEALTAEGLPAGSTLKDLIANGVISGTLTVVAYGDDRYAEYANMGSAYQVGGDIRDENGNRISYIVIPEGLSSSSYNIVFKPGKLLVEPKSIVVNLDDKSSVYGEKDKELTASVADGTLYGFDPAETTVVDFLKINGLKREQGTDAGSYAITASGSDNENYRVTFVNGVYTVTQYEVTVNWVSGKEEEGKENDFDYIYNGGAFSPVATFEMPNPEDPDNPLIFKSTDDEAVRVIEIMGSGVNAGTYKAQAFLLNKNLKFSTASTNQVTKEFKISPKQLTVTWYKDKDEIGVEGKEIDPAETTTTPVSYDYRVGEPWAPVAVVDGIEDVDKGVVSVQVSGQQNSVNKNGPYEAKVWVLGSSNYIISKSDATVMFVIVMSAPGDFKWEGKTEYVFNGTAQQPVAFASNNAYFIYKVELLGEDGEADKTVAYAISVGKYRITAEPKDANFEIPADKKSFEFEITPFKAEVKWSADSFEYNGAIQKPTAYFIDAFGQHVELEVILADGNSGIEGGNEYTVTVTLNAPADGVLNYTFVDEDENLVTTLTKTYTITKKVIEVTWTSDYKEDESGNFKWEAVYDGQGDESESVHFVASMKNEVEKLALDVKVYWQAKAGDEPVEVDKVHDAGIYTWCVSLSDANGSANANYNVVNAERTFEITRPKLTITAADQEVKTGANAPVLSATFDGLRNETAEELGLVKDGKYSWLDTNYNQNSPYIDASKYDEPEKLETLADLTGLTGYFIVLTDSEAKLKELNAILKNYDWSFDYGKMIIIAVEGDVKIISVKEYNGEDQKPSAQYKNTAGNWIDLNVVVYNKDYTEIVENPEVKNVGTYYLLLKKHEDNNTTLAGAETEGEFAGCVKKEFTITARHIEIKISDKSVEYGKVTRDDYDDYLTWAYSSEDPSHKPLSGDELDIALSIDFASGSFDKGNYLNAGYYDIEGSWNTDMTNYKVTFVGSKEDKGVLEIKLAQISFKESGEYNQVIEQDDRLTMSLGATDDDGKYVNFSFAGYEDADIEFYFSNPYSWDNNDPDKIKPDKDPSVTNTVSPIFYRTGNDSRYFVNFKIVIPNHETYYGQWKVIVLVDTIYIRILFVDGKTYDAVYGDAVPDGKQLATQLWDGGYIDKLSTGIQNAKFKEYIENGLVTAKVVTDDVNSLKRGSYSIVFEGFENVEDGKYQVTYKENVTDPDSMATNVGKFVVNQRELTIAWDKTSFVYDGQSHLPTPEIEGWTRLPETQTVNGATVYTFTNSEIGKTITLTVRTNGGDFTTIGSENFVIAEISDDNYALDAFNATRAVSITGDMGGNTAPVQTESGVPLWLIIIVAVALVVALIALVIVLVKRRSPSGDEDGFYDPAE